MEQVWRTVDGSFFKEAADAQKHEKEVLSNINMYDLEGKRTESTDHAYAVFLPNDNSATIFRSLLAANSEDPATYDRVEEEDTGWYYWDDCEEIWRFISRNAVRAFAAIVNSDSAKF